MVLYLPLLFQITDLYNPFPINTSYVILHNQMACFTNNFNMTGFVYVLYLIFTGIIVGATRDALYIKFEEKEFMRKLCKNITKYECFVINL